MMGWSPAQVGAAPVWKLIQAFDGWKSFHASGGEPKAPTDEEFDRAVMEARLG
jgi:hypothetical protein